MRPSAAAPTISRSASMRSPRPSDERKRRPEQLVQSGERYVGLEFDAMRREQPHRSRLGHRLLEKRRLADAGLTPNDEPGALAHARRRQRLAHHPHFAFPAKEHRVIVPPTTRWG